MNSIRLICAIALAAIMIVPAFGQAITLESLAADQDGMFAWAQRTSANVTAVQNSVSELFTKLDNIEQRLNQSTTSSEISSLREEIADLRQDIQNAAGSNSALQAQYSGLSTRIENTNVQMETMNSTVQGQYQSLEGRVTSLENLPMYETVEASQLDQNAMRDTVLNGAQAVTYGGVTLQPNQYYPWVDTNYLQGPGNGVWAISMVKTWVRVA